MKSQLFLLFLYDMIAPKKEVHNMKEEDLLKKAIDTKNEQQQTLLLFKLFLSIYKDKKTKNKKLLDVISILSKENICYDEILFAASFASAGIKQGLSYKQKFEQAYGTKENYQSILNNFQKLTQELNLDNSLKVTLLYAYLLWNGYFSKNCFLQFQEENRSLIPGLYSYDISRGIGVCLNFSEMLADILNACGYQSAITICHLKSSRVISGYMPPIQQNYKQYKSNQIENFLCFLKNLRTPITMDHAINIIKEKNHLYAYDVTNLLMVNIANSQQAYNMLGKDTYLIDPYVSYTYNMSSTAQKALDFLNFKRNYINPYSKKEYINTSEEYTSLFDESYALFQEFYTDIYQDIINISDSASDYHKRNPVQYVK